MTRLDPERLDLTALARMLRSACGRSVLGHTGRERLARLVTQHLGCSSSEGVLAVDAMVERGLIVARERDGLTEWQLVVTDE